MEFRLGEQDEKRISSSAEVVFAYHPDDYSKSNKKLTALSFK